MKRIFLLVLTFVTVIFSGTGCTVNESKTDVTSSNKVSMQYGCVNPIFDYFDDSGIPSLKDIDATEAPADLSREVYGIMDDVVTYLFQTYNLQLKSHPVSIYVCDLEGFLKMPGVAGLYDNSTDSIYLDYWVTEVDRSSYYRLIAHEICHLLQSYNALDPSDKECFLEENNKFLGYHLSEGICEKIACEVTAWKSSEYDASPIYKDEYYASYMIEVSVPNMTNFFFNYDVLSFEKEINDIIDANTTYDSSKCDNISAFEHLLYHIDMCGAYRNSAYAGDQQSGSIYVYSCTAVIEMCCAMSRNLPESKKEELWKIIYQYDNASFRGTMISQNEDLFKSALY